MNIFSPLLNQRYYDILWPGLLLNFVVCRNTKACIGCMHYREKSPEKYLNLPKNVYLVSDFCQIGNLAAFRFLPKKEPESIPVSNKRRNLRLSDFCQRGKLGWLSSFYTKEGTSGLS
jgi:hypothetical protein